MKLPTTKALKYEKSILLASPVEDSSCVILLLESRHRAERVFMALALSCMLSLAVALAVIAAVMM